jgi:hypothetical protein
MFINSSHFDRPCKDGPGQPGQDIQDRTARTRHSGQDSPCRILRTGLLGQDMLDKTDRTGQ